MKVSNPSKRRTGAASQVDMKLSRSSNPQIQIGLAMKTRAEYARGLYKRLRNLGLITRMEPLEVTSLGTKRGIQMPELEKQKLEKHTLEKLMELLGAAEDCDCYLLTRLGVWSSMQLPEIAEQWWIIGEITEALREKGWEWVETRPEFDDNDDRTGNWCLIITNAPGYAVETIERTLFECYVTAALTILGEGK
jgi:hypothetical protein